MIRMKTKVFNLIILDESGSMSCIDRQALNGLNETLQTIRRAQDKFPEQEQLVSIVPFESGNIRLLRDKVSIKEVNDLRPDEYNPGACTPLYDAIGFGINSSMSRRLSDISVLNVLIGPIMKQPSVHTIWKISMSRLRGTCQLILIT